MTQPTWISWSDLMWRVEISKRLKSHDSVGFRSWATVKETPRCTSSTLTPLIPNTRLAARKPYSVSAGTLSCWTNSVLEQTSRNTNLTHLSYNTFVLPWGWRWWLILILCHGQSESIVNYFWPIQSRNSTQSLRYP